MCTKILLLVVALLASIAIVQGVAISKGNNGQINTDSQSTIKVNPNNGIAVQTGYEGYISTVQKKDPGLYKLVMPGNINMAKALMIGAWNVLLKFGLVTAGLVVKLTVALLLGIAITTGICTYTPLCTIAAGPGLSFLSTSVKDQVAELSRSYMTPETLKIVSGVVQSALAEYNGRNKMTDQSPVKVESRENQIQENEAKTE